MIPKVIHYCWFGGNPLPPLAEKCIASWKKFLPDYQIKRWDESNFDVNMIPYTSQAFEAKKYAFVSDYARFWILYNYGGIYFDTDVEVLRPMDDIIAAGPFMGCENPPANGNNADTSNLEPGLELGVNPGLGIGAPKGLNLYKELLNLYDSMSFIDEKGWLNTVTIVSYTTNLLCKYGLLNISDIQNICGIKIYPVDYFCPIDYKSGKCAITNNTYSIHHYAESWHGSKEKIYKFLGKIIGKNSAKKIANLIKRILIKH